MQQVSEHVDAAYLQQSTPRPLSPVLLLNLFGEYTFERPERFLNPMLLLSVVALLVLTVMRMPLVLVALPLTLLVGMFLFGTYRIGMRVWDDIFLLRNGLMLRAHILKLRPNRTLTGDIEGALLDCAIAVAPRRTYVGSIWVADGNEALRLLRQGRLQVLCLPRTPGTWRVLEPIQSSVRYDRIMPVIIPHDV
ncbi:hypothetical protein F8S13_19860 [Chloroflexia bacterium SDU3-3]|nr:hypothetical protein F8S13_19860 [Chloroflexia bacterium SDU3-3]